MDMVPEGNMVVIMNQDQPGVIGFVGNTFGNAKVNIADMVISREFKPDGSAVAMMLIKTDQTPPDSLIQELSSRPYILSVHSATLPPRK